MWVREDKFGAPESRIPDRSFRRRLLDARQNTAIDPDSDTAADGSLRETECILPQWRPKHGNSGTPLAMTGYVFVRNSDLTDRLEHVRHLFLGGDTRYGLGLVERDATLIQVERFFGDGVELGFENPRVISSVLRAHAPRFESDSLPRGTKERVVGWLHKKLDVSGSKNTLWVPGSILGQKATWEVRESGIWSPSAHKRPSTADTGGAMTHSEHIARRALRA
jgi:hypothetical protein